jgi:hypothetical protein
MNCIGCAGAVAFAAPAVAGEAAAAVFTGTVGLNFCAISFNY